MASTHVLIEETKQGSTMNIHSLSYCTVAALVVAATSFCGAAHAQDAYPARPITLIVPWATGGSTDLTARALAKAAEKYLGQTIVVNNKPGAGTAVGMSDLAQARPDGYTIGTLSTTAYLFPLTGKEVPYDALKSFTYISYYGDNLIGTAVMADAPWSSLKDLIADGKQNPGKIKFGTGGVWTTQHLIVEGVMSATGARFIHIPQQGSAASMPAVLGRHVDFLSETSVWAPFVDDKQVRLLSVSTPERSDFYPNVPTLKELGFPSLRSVQAVLGPAGMSEPVRAKLEDAFRKSLKDDGFQATMRRLAMVVVDMSGKDTQEVVRSEIDRTRALLDEIKKK
jgi:tripartite-type tricarboxylate transporter receptor subunit TctC